MPNWWWARRPYVFLRLFRDSGASVFGFASPPLSVSFVKTAVTDTFLDFLPASFKNLETPRTKFSSKFWSKADRYRRIGKSVLLSPYLEFRFLANFDKHGYQTRVSDPRSSLILLENDAKAIQELTVYLVRVYADTKFPRKKKNAESMDPG